MRLLTKAVSLTQEWKLNYHIQGCALKLHMKEERTHTAFTQPHISMHVCSLAHRMALTDFRREWNFDNKTAVVLR